MPNHAVLQDIYSSDASIPDPGNGGIIIADRSPAVCELVVAAASETRTLAAPLSSGLILAITMKVDGGDVTVSLAGSGTLNAAGNTAANFGDVNDTIVVMSVPLGASAYRWCLLVNDGTTLSP